MTTMTGDFEAHFTLATLDEAAQVEVARWAEARALKVTHIVLDRGANPSQRMLTQHFRGSLTEALVSAQARCQQLTGAGFPVTRLKLEAAPWNTGIPQDAHAATAFPAHCHFEHHLKLLLDSEEALDALRAQVEPHQAHLSRNARRTRSDGQHERFVTQRCYGVGQSVARARLAALTEALIGFTILETEEEFVVHDSNLALDQGWLALPEHSHAH